jgi:hypothetical protein
MADLWKQVIPSIMTTKNNVLLTPEDVASYNAFMVNKALSYHLDTIFLANQMNLNPHLDKKVQYDYLMSTVRGHKRPFNKWATKTPIPKEVAAIQEYYNLSDQKALEAYKVLTKDEVDFIVSQVEAVS